MSEADAGKLAVVYGGSGFVGRNVVRELAKRGWRVRVAVRRPHHAQFLKPAGVVGQIQLLQANLRNEASVREALTGADAVINCVGILFQDGEQKFQALQTDGARRVAAFAAEEGIEDVVHISAIGADPMSDSDYARSKGEGEAAVREASPSARILRPSIVFGQEDQFFNRFAAMAASTPFTPLPLIGGGATRFQPVYVDDVADAVAAVLTRPETAGRTYELGGPNIYTFKELLQLMLKEIRRPRILVPIPGFAAPIVGLSGELAGALPFVDPPITRDQVKLLARDNIVSDDSAVGRFEDLAINPKSVESILPSYMVRFRRYGQFSENSAA